MADQVMFNELVIETTGYCNRSCPTCLRNSHPDRPALASRFTNTARMSTETFQRIVDQAVGMGFTGAVNIQFFDEPLVDRRLAEFGRYAKSKDVFSVVRCFSNGDLMTSERAAELDGAFDRMHISLYGDIGGVPLVEGLDERVALLRSWFRETELVFTGGGHTLTHYSPWPGLGEAIEASRGLPCIFDSHERMIIDHRGEMLMCCDDIMGEWNLGNVAEASLPDLWFSDKHMAIITALEKPGGRANFPYCSDCPRQ